MIWADFLFEHPEAFALLPDGLLLIDWWYEANHDFDRVRRLQGRPFFVAAGTSGWNTLFPRVGNALANIRGYAQAVKRHGGEGLLVTEWGDGGHGNLLGNALYGFAFGAQAAWASEEPEAGAFDRSFSWRVFSDPSGAAGRLYRRLGDLHETGFEHFNHSPLKTLFFDDVVEAKYTSKASARVLKSTLAGLRRIRPELVKAEEELRSRPAELEELRYALEASILAAEKGLAGIEYLRLREKEDRAARKSLAAELARIEREQRRLQQRLRKLWLARNRPAGFEKMRAQYETSIRGLRRAVREVAVTQRRGT
jgi:hypothetical protein